MLGLVWLGNMRYPSGVISLTGCCPNGNPFERSLKRFLSTNLDEAEDKRCQLFEPKGRVLTLPGASLRFVKNGLDQAKRDFGNGP